MFWITSCTKKIVTPDNGCLTCPGTFHVTLTLFLSTWWWICGGDYCSWSSGNTSSQKSEKITEKLLPEVCSFCWSYNVSVIIGSVELQTFLRWCNFWKVFMTVCCWLRSVCLCFMPAWFLWCFYAYNWRMMLDVHYSDGWSYCSRAGEHPSASRWCNCITKSLQDSLRCVNVAFADGCSHTLGMNETRTQLLITNAEISSSSHRVFHFVFETCFNLRGH